MTRVILKKAKEWNIGPRSGDSLSAKIKQVERIPLVGRHVVQENYLIGTSPPDKKADCLSKRSFSSSLFSFRRSMKKTSK